MELYESNPADRYFADVQMDVKNVEDIATSDTLYIRHDFITQTVNIDVYSSPLRDYLLKETLGKNHTIDDVKDVFKRVSELSEVPVPKSYVKKVSEFIAHAADGFALGELVLTEDSYEPCEQCGSYNNNSVFGYYFSYPEPSIAFAWDYGCYGGSAEAGGVSDVKDSVLALARQAANAADGDRSKKVKRFIEKVQAL